MKSSVQSRKVLYGQKTVVYNQHEKWCTIKKRGVQSTCRDQTGLYQTSPGH